MNSFVLLWSVMRLLRKPIVHIALLTFLAMFNLTFVVPSIKELIMDGFGASSTEASLFVTVEMAAYIIFGVVWGALSDKRGERRLFIVVGFFGSALMYYTMSLAPDLFTLLALRFVQGALTVMAWSLLMTMALDMAHITNYGRSMGIVGGGLALGIGFGAPVGGFVGDFGAKYPLYLASAVFLVATALSIMLLKDIPIKNKPQSLASAIRYVGEDRQVLAPFLYSFAERFSAGYLVMLLPLYMAEEFGSEPSVRGMYLAAFLIPFALFQYPFGKLSDKYGRTWMLIVGGIAYAGMLSMLGYVGMEAMLMLMIVSGALAAMILPASLAILGEMAPKGEHGTYMGGFNAFGSLGFALAPPLATTLSVELGYSHAFAAGGLIIALTVVASLFIFWVAHGPFESPPGEEGEDPVGPAEPI
jgi:MFS family permease